MAAAQIARQIGRLWSATLPYDIHHAAIGKFNRKYYITAKMNLGVSHSTLYAFFGDVTGFYHDWTMAMRR